MSRVQTNNTSFRFARESSIGVLPGSPEWRLLEVNTPGAFGAAISTVERRPISADRGRKKGTVTDLDSGADWEADLTLDSFVDFAEGFVFSEFANVEFDLKLSGAPPTATAGTDDFNIDSASTLLAGKVQFAAGGIISLVYAKGYTNSENNGLHALAVDLAATDTTVQVASTLVTETPPANASLQVAGLRMDDATFTVSGSTATLASAADVDWTTVGLFVGQLIHLGSDDGTGAVQNAMQDSVANDTFGYARITAITATTLSLDKLDVNLGAGGSPYTPATLDVMFGRFLRNVAVQDDSDDQRFLEQSYQIEAAYPDLGGAGVDEYEYAIGNFANELAMNIAGQDKTTANWGFIGTNSDDITPTRKTNAASAVAPLRNTAINTSSDVASLSTDLISSASDVCFKDLTVTLNNNVSPEKCIGTLGAVFVNSGLFEVNLSGEMLFTNKEIVNAIKNNTTTTFLSILKNSDGAIAIDVPSLTFGDGARGFPVDESVTVSITGTAFNDPVGTIPNVSVGISLFANVPTVRP